MTDERERPEPESDDEPRRWTPATIRWWRRGRLGLVLIELWAQTRENVALACGARAIALLGDEVFRTAKHD